LTPILSAATPAKKPKTAVDQRVIASLSFKSALRTSSPVIWLREFIISSSKTYSPPRVSPLVTVISKKETARIIQR